MRQPLQFGEFEVTVHATIMECAEDDLMALEWMGLYSRHRHIIREAFMTQQRGGGLMLSLSRPAFRSHRSECASKKGAVPLRLPCGPYGHSFRCRARA